MESCHSHTYVTTNDFQFLVFKNINFIMTKSKLLRKALQVCKCHFKVQNKIINRLKMSQKMRPRWLSISRFAK